MEVAGKFSKQIVYTDTSETLIGSLPPNSVITAIKVLVSTAFTAGGADVIDIGIEGTAAYYANDTDVSSVADASVTRTSASFGIQSTSDTTDIYATYVPAGSSPTAGACDVVIEYVQY